MIINEETAPIVRRMFEMCAAGIGSKSIATTLNREGILSPKEYTRFRKHKPERDGEFERRHFWTRTYVQFMLKNEIYVGSMVQGRQYTPSYRSKKRELIPKEYWIVVPNMHELIVSRELFDEAQKRMGRGRKPFRPKRNRICSQGFSSVKPVERQCCPRSASRNISTTPVDAAMRLEI